MPRTLLFLSLLLCTFELRGGYALETDLPYWPTDASSAPDSYKDEQCRLDVYVPEDAPGFATVIWLHGGGLTGGHKEVPPMLRERGIGVVAVGYRLSPQAELPAFLEDAAAATAWVFQHIAAYGGDPEKIFLSGHSAGGYLAAMVGMDPKWLAPHDLKPTDLAGVIPVSGQVSTHFRVKALRGDTGPALRVVVDEFAPLTYASKDLPPICLIVGDRRIEYRNRVEENDLLATSLRNLGHPQVEFYEMGGLNHGTVVPGSGIITIEFIHRVLKKREDSLPTSS